MRIIRLIIISIIVFLIIITIISLFIPSNIRISKAVQVYSSKQSVMAQLSDPAKWRDWYPGAGSSKYYYQDDTIKGLILNESKKQSIIRTGATDDEVTAVYLMGNKKIPTGWQIAAANNSVTVQWHIDFHLRWYPWEKFTSFLFDKVYDPQLQEGLDNLKTLLEKNSNH